MNLSKTGTPEEVLNYIQDVVDMDQEEKQNKLMNEADDRDIDIANGEL